MNQTESSFIFKQGHLPTLDGLRGISIILVIVGHFFYQREFALLKIFSADFGVKVFFVISGFLITTLLLKEKQNTNSISLKKFYIRRSLRIFPVAYLYLIVLLALNFCFKLNLQSDSFISAALYIRNTPILPVDDWWTGHYWSLSVEEQFYLLFPFLLMLNLKIYRIVICLLLVLIPILNYAVVYEFLEGNFIDIVNQVFKNMTPILVGSLLSVIIYHKPSVVELTRKSLKRLGLILLILAAIVQSGLIPYLPSSLTATLSSLLIAVFIIIHLSPSNTLTFKILNSRVLTLIGILSYSLYIWQQLFTQHVPWENSTYLLSSPIINLLLLIIVSLLSYYLFELRFLNLKRKFAVTHNYQ